MPRLDGGQQLLGQLGCRLGRFLCLQLLEQVVLPDVVLDKLPATLEEADTLADQVVVAGESVCFGELLIEVVEDAGAGRGRRGGRGRQGLGR